MIAQRTTRTTWQTFCLALLVQLLGIQVAAAQTPVSMAQLSAGCCTVRVRQNGVTAQGRFAGWLAETGLVLRSCDGLLCPAPPDSIIRFAQGTRLEVQRGRSAGQGAIIGAGVGALGLTVVWLAESQRLGISKGEALIGLPIGALGGSALGALVGSLFPKWRALQP